MSKKRAFGKSDAEYEMCNEVLMSQQDEGRPAIDMSELESVKRELEVTRAHA